MREKILEKAFEDLLLKQRSMDKGSYINYGDKLKMQDYLLENSSFSVDQQKLLFSLRCRTNLYIESFYKKEDTGYCETKCGNILSYKHI